MYRMRAWNQGIFFIHISSETIEIHLIIYNPRVSNIHLYQKQPDYWESS